MSITMSPLRRLVFLLVAWGAAAAAAGHFHALARLPAWSAPLFVVALSALLTLSAFRIGWVRCAFDALGTDRILALHGFRFIGFGFLLYQAQGLLPEEFAERAGWGDVATAASALGLLLLGDGPVFGRLLPFWNGFGIVDLAVAVGTAGWLTVSRPGSMQAIAGLPLALVPLWIVPVLVATHVVLMTRSRPFERAPAVQA